MNRDDLAEELRKELRLFSRAAGRRIVDATVEIIRREVRAGHSIRIQNFGVFRQRTYKGKEHCVFDDSKNFFRE